MQADGSTITKQSHNLQAGQAVRGGVADWRLHSLDQGQNYRYQEDEDVAKLHHSVPADTQVKYLPESVHVLELSIFLYT